MNNKKLPKNRLLVLALLLWNHVGHTVIPETGNAYPPVAQDGYMYIMDQNLMVKNPEEAMSPVQSKPLPRRNKSFYKATVNALD